MSVVWTGARRSLSALCSPPKPPPTMTTRCALWSCMRRQRLAPLARGPDLLDDARAHSIGVRASAGVSEESHELRGPAHRPHPRPVADAAKLGGMETALRGS